MSWLSKLFGGGDDNQETKSSDSNQIWPRWMVAPQYSFTEPRLQLTSDFISEQIKRLNEGQYPSYYDKALPTLRESMHRPNYEAYYGKAGEPGVLRGQMDVGSITGLGPRKTQAGVERSLSEYATNEKAIDEYLTKMGVDIMREEAYRFPSLSIAMPKGPDAQLAYPMIQPSNQTDWGGLFSSLGSMFNLGGLFGGGDKTTTTTQPSQNVTQPAYYQSPNYQDYARLIQPSDPYQKYYDSVPASSQIGTSYTSKDFGLYQ